MTLPDALREYVTVRRALGTQLREPAVTLGRFVEFLEREGADRITTELAVRWAEQSELAQPATRARRLSMARRFAAWLSASDPRTEVPPKGILAARHRRPRPYIFDDPQVEQLMTEAARLPSRTGLRALGQVTLIGLLASTGLRPGEALGLDVSDVDLSAGVLAIRRSKFGKSRHVPVDASTGAALTRYARRRDELFRPRRTDAFLVSELGTRLQPFTARRTFAELCCAIGLRPPEKDGRIGRGPRLQDLRHTFATRTLLDWYRAGVDVQRRLPTLSTYLGHVSVANTYWYIEAVPELLQLAARCPTSRRGGER